MTGDYEPLLAFGLSEVEAAVYVALVAGGESTVPAVARRAGRSAAAAKAALESLVGLGLALPGVSDSGFVAAPVQPALDDLSRRRREELTTADEFARDLAARATAAQQQQSPLQVVGVVVGTAAIRSMHEQMQRSATSEMRMLDRPPYVTDVAAGGTGVDPVQQDRMAEQVRYRTIYDAALLDSPAHAARIRSEVEAGEEGRVLADLPLKLVIADRSLAMLPLIESSGSDHRAALIVRPSVLLDSLVTLFEALWAAALPLAPSEAASADEVRQVVELLAGGITEERMARLLGVSVRTVRRRLAEARAELNAETMFQAGAESARRGWV